MFKSRQRIENDFRKDIPNSTDEQIIEILKKRDHYQSEAAELAISEAIARGIIYSREDLFAEEYKVEELKTSVFPTIHDAGNKHKIRKSIARSLVLCGVIPVVFGFVRLNSGDYFEGGTILFFGVLWIVSAAQLIKDYQKLLVHLLLMQTVLGLLYVVVKLLSKRQYVFMDFFIPAALFLLVVYGLFFLKRSST